MNTQIETMTELAKLVGRDPGTLSRWVRRPDWPFARRAPWPQEIVDQVQAWARSNLSPNPAVQLESHPDPIAEIRGLSPERRAKLQLIVERAAKIKLEREMMLGWYVKKEEVERETIQRIYAVKAEMMNVRGLAIKLEGQDLQEREKTLENWGRNICNKFAGKEE